MSDLHTDNILVNICVHIGLLRTLHLPRDTLTVFNQAQHQDENRQRRQTNQRELNIHDKHKHQDDNQRKQIRNHIDDAV